MAEMADVADDFGGMVELSGFKDVDAPAMNDLKGIVGSYVKRFTELCRGFERLSVKMKKVHAQPPHSEKYEIHATLIDRGRLYASTTTDNNLLFAVEAALGKVKNEIGEK